MSGDVGWGDAEGGSVGAKSHGEQTAPPSSDSARAGARVLDSVTVQEFEIHETRSPLFDIQKLITI